MAANENTESQKIDIKQSLLLHKIWYSYLKYKLDNKLNGAIRLKMHIRILDLLLACRVSRRSLIILLAKVKTRHNL